MGWTPIRFEEKFGISNAPALVLDLGTEEVRLRGLIDRVDRNEFGGLRIIDYKTGGANLSNKDLIGGRRLQMPIYALAAQHALRLGTVEEGFYWQIRAAKPSYFKLSKFKNNQQKGPQAAYTIALDHIRRMLGGVRSGSFLPIPPGDGCPSYCPAVQWCWRYQPGY
jgi:RecB family exonuclease